MSKDTDKKEKYDLEDGTPQCQHCGNNFDDRESLEKHIDREHPSMSEFTIDNQVNLDGHIDGGDYVLDDSENDLSVAEGGNVIDDTPIYQDLFSDSQKSSTKGDTGVSDTMASDLMRDDYRDFHKGILDNSEVIEEYSLDEYSSVQILFNPYINENLYRVVEPELTDTESRLRRKVSKDIREDFENLPVENMDRSELKESVTELAEKHLNRQKTILGTLGNTVSEKYNSLVDTTADYISFEDTADNIKMREFETITEENINKVLYYVVRDYAEYEKLTPVMKDENTEDISCNGPDIPVFLYHKTHRDVITNIMYKPEELDEFVGALAQKAGKHISIAEPDMQGRLPDGSRMQLTYTDEISDEGSNFTIRQFQEEPFTPIDLIEYDTFSLSQMAYLWMAIENEKSLIFAGGTASGKTTSMNAISLFIPPRSKIVSIEDTREITLRHSNWIKSVTRESFGGGGSGEVDMYDLLRDALRQRPEYIIVGEIRGEEARTLFQAMSTGHTTYSTMHADDVQSAVRRLENEPINLPRQMLSSLDILSVQIRIIDDGDSLRRCKEMVEIVDIKSDTNEIQSRTVFEYNPKNDDIEFKGESDVLEDIRAINNLSKDELQNEIDRRKKVLKYLINEVQTRDYQTISSVLRTYMQDKKIVMDQIRKGELLKGK